MVKHVLLLDLKDEYSKEEKIQIAKKIKNDVEALRDLKGVLKLNVWINPALFSNSEILLDSEFESEEAFNNYQNYPDHVKVKEYIASVVKLKKCFDGII